MRDANSTYILNNWSLICCIYLLTSICVGEVKRCDQSDGLYAVSWGLGWVMGLGLFVISIVLLSFYGVII